MSVATAAPEREPIAHDPVLSTRQEAFCRYFTASGNAADAARRAGYAEGSARQTGHALLERPWPGFLPNVTACVASRRSIRKERAERHSGAYG